MEVQTCSGCGMKVVPNAAGICPSCNSSIRSDISRRIAPPENPFESPVGSCVSDSTDSSQKWSKHLVWIVGLAAVHLGLIAWRCPYLISGQWPQGPGTLSPSESFYFWLLSLPLGFWLKPGNILFAVNSCVLATLLYAVASNFRSILHVTEHGLFSKVKRRD